jgi:phosphatidylserine decarboxylase
MSILKEGYPFIIPSLAAGIALAVISVIKLNPPLYYLPFSAGIILIIFSLFCMFFFRDPKTVITQGEGIILSPCSGTVMEIADDSETGEKIIRVFLSIFSVHLQRAPVSGVITDVKHKDGKFLAAWNPRAQIENEQNIFTIQSDAEYGGVFTVRQIAGLVARRCVSWVKAGDCVKAGDKIGMIKFSSQVDLHMPGEFKIKAVKGDKLNAGVTVIAEK